ncbi:MAG: hypothetical protein MUE44_32415 [Oscillatoriaceae cyanobacterium Prado104]|jgi:hypothetical protein|nr:hypothetical protein [Oscillatoriaceae cyanobacterium Prado104]
MNAIARIIAEVDGVEFYTDAATGKSGISQTGLAVLCGVSRQSISKLINSLSTKCPSEWLEPIAHRVAALSTKTVSGLILYADELCIAVIRHYWLATSISARTARTSLATAAILSRHDSGNLRRCRRQTSSISQNPPTPAP